MIDSPLIFTNQKVAEKFKFEIQPGHGKMVNSPLIFDNQKLAEKFKLKI